MFKKYASPEHRRKTHLNDAVLDWLSDAVSTASITKVLSETSKIMWELCRDDFLSDKKVMAAIECLGTAARNAESRRGKLLE